MILLSKFMVVIFGLFLIFAGFVMLIDPKRARGTLQKAGSTHFINYTEISLRLIIGVSFIFYAGYSKFSIAFSILGWFMLITSLILFAVPVNLHHSFSLKSATILTPRYWQLISPFSVFFGALIIYAAT